MNCLKETDIGLVESICDRPNAYETFIRTILKRGKEKSVVNNNELNIL